VSTQLDGFDEWMADLERAATEVTPEARKVVVKACVNVTKDWRRRWTGIPLLPHLPRAIGYDVTTIGTVITGEVGPDSAKLQGTIAPVIEYGSVNSAPHPGGLPALEAELPKFERALEDLGERLLS
jgi:hypothetical protein